MKNVLYLMKYYLDPSEAPPFPKFDYQMQALSNLGYNVFFLGIEHGVVYLCNNGNRERIASIPLHTVPGIGRILTFKALYRATYKLFNGPERFFACYIRLMPAVPPMIKALKNMKRSGCKTVMEIPTYPPEREEQTEKRLHRRLFFRLFRGYELQTAQWLDLYALIGKLHSESYRNVPAVNITNGISLDHIPLRTYKPVDEHMHLIGVANIQLMNAYDRVIQGIYHYNRKKQPSDVSILFHVIGPDRDGTLETLRKLVDKTHLSDFIIFEGPVFGSRLDGFFNMADAAVGSLGLHRIGHSGIATLKAREYLARGIPFIASGTDPVIPQDQGWCLNVPQDESAIDMEEVLRFILQTRSHPSLGAQMRNFAREHLSWEQQFIQVFEALEHAPKKLTRE